MPLPPLKLELLIGDMRVLAMILIGKNCCVCGDPLPENGRVTGMVDGTGTWIIHEECRPSLRAVD